MLASLSLMIREKHGCRHNTIGAQEQAAAVALNAALASNSLSARQLWGNVVAVIPCPIS
eukprot:COSAG02_NODE_1977_length_10205_cov_5.317633_6_plen_59_part_00